MQAEKQGKEGGLGWFLYFILILALLVAAFIAFSVYSKQPEGFSEAWLNESNEGAFSFSIKNSFAAAKNYRYEILLEGKPIADENVLLQAKEEKSFSQQIDLGPAGNESKKIELLVWREGREEPFDLWKWVEVK